MTARARCASLRRCVLHVTGPHLARGAAPTAEQQRQLAQCYLGVLEAAARRGLRSVAFCSISTGEFCYPAAEAAQLATSTVRSWVEAHPAAMDAVVFDVFGDEQLAIYSRVVPAVFGAGAAVPPPPP